MTLSDLQNVDELIGVVSLLIFKITLPNLTLYNERHNKVRGECSYTFPLAYIMKLERRTRKICKIFIR